MDIKKQFIKERDAAIRSLDVEQFKTHYRKWKSRGFYELPLPRDIVIEVALRKMLVNTKSAPEPEKEEARKWLYERGCTAKVFDG